MAEAKQLITEHIDVWTSAIKKRNSQGRGSSKKIELTGVKKLRELILELAVRGKLVPQDPSDEPASVLLEKIAEDKAQLIIDKKIKKQKPLPAITNEEKLFELQGGWEWSRLGNVGIGSTGKTPSTRNTAFFDGDIQFVGPGNITPKGEMLKSDKYLTELGLEQSTSAVSGDILMVCIGGSIGKSAIATELVAFNQQINSIRPIELLSMFLKITVSTNSFYQDVIDKSTGSATPIINRGKWEELVVPVAPLAEQHRIVAKVDELMALCDELEQQTEQSLSAHQTLVEVLLASLTNGTSTDDDNKEDFQTSWQRIAEHFDVLFTTEASIEQLKQTILQLAVIGKLVPQNPADEPASVLLEKIAKEKAQLITDKKIKKQKPLPAITDEEKPFELPNGWEWVILQDITSKITDGDHQTPPRISSGFRLLSAKNVRDGYLDTSNCDFIAEEHYIKSRERCFPEEGDLLIVSVGGTIGRSSVVPNDSSFALVRSVALIKPLMLNPFYFKYAMDSKLLQESIHARKRGGAQPCLYLSEIGKFPFSLPPLAEQHRIVAKVDELMALCDQLKARLNDAQTTQLHLADAVVENALT
jgi:type I restriction enzyme S subunit